jgi:hypothetical protein
MENININKDIEKEWKNLKTMIHNAANESLGKYRKYTKKSYRFGIKKSNNYFQ